MKPTKPHRPRTTPRASAWPLLNFTAAARSASLNRWREYNAPLQHLKLGRVVALLHASQLGLWADLQWTYKFIEERDPTLLALIERRTSALLQLDFHCQPSPPERLPIGASSTEAQAQADALSQAYDRIENLREAIQFLALASFRGFSHLEKINDDAGRIIRLDPVEQWHWTRKSRHEPWLYNAPALQTNHGTPIDPARFIIREVDRPIDPIGLVNYVRKGLTHQGWDSYVEVYGLPGVVVLGPPNAPTSQDGSFAKTAEEISRGGSGHLPAGSDIKFTTVPTHQGPFADSLRALNEELVLAGTGGLLTMLAESGSGTLAGSVHENTFSIIARAEARKISEEFQRQFDVAILDALFPGRPHLASFEIAANEETNTAEVIDHVLKLSQAGLAIDPAQVTEKTGYRVKPASPPAPLL